MEVFVTPKNDGWDGYRRLHATALGPSYLTPRIVEEWHIAYDTWQDMKDELTRDKRRVATRLDTDWHARFAEAERRMNTAHQQVEQARQAYLDEVETMIQIHRDNGMTSWAE